MFSNSQLTEEFLQLRKWILQLSTCQLNSISWRIFVLKWFSPQLKNMFSWSQFTLQFITNSSSAEDLHLVLSTYSSAENYFSWDLPEVWWIRKKFLHISTNLAVTLLDSLQYRCSNHVGTTFVRRELLRIKFFSWNFLILVVGLQLTLKLTKKFSLFSFSVQTINFLSSANFDFHTKFLFDQTMHQWCRNNFCPARFAEEKVFLLKLFNLAFHFFSSHWINEEISLSWTSQLRAQFPQLSKLWLSHKIFIWSNDASMM